MTNFEIAVTLMFIAYSVIFGIICAGSFNRTRRTNLAIKHINHILDCHNMRIDGVIDRMDHLVLTVGDYMDKTHELSKEKDRADKKIGAGKWIRIESDGTYGICYWYRCSICGNRAPKNDYGVEYFSIYCPTCGANMELEGEG